MGSSVFSRALRAGLLVCGLAWLWPAETSAQMLRPFDASRLIQRTAEPFGIPASPLLGGGLVDKWRNVQRRLADEMVQIALCDGDRDGCVSPSALRFLEIVDAARRLEGRARLGEINRALNLAIRPVSDGPIDVWSTPLETLAKGTGDCEDYAIAKFLALRFAGIDSDEIRIVVVHDAVHREHHAVAAARLDGRWLTLDNRRMAMVEDSAARNYRPAFVIDQHDVMRYSDAPMQAIASGSAPAFAAIAHSPTVAAD